MSRFEWRVSSVMGRNMKMRGQCWLNTNRLFDSVKYKRERGHVGSLADQFRTL
jgi:hypothetical protein